MVPKIRHTAGEVKTVCSKSKSKTLHEKAVKPEGYGKQAVVKRQWIIRNQLQVNSSVVSAMSDSMRNVPDCFAAEGKRFTVVYTGHRSQTVCPKKNTHLQIRVIPRLCYWGFWI